MAFRKRGGEGEQLRKLFIGGITHDTTEKDLREYYGQFGDLVDAVVMVHKGTNRSRGFGFVTFSDPSMVDQAQSARPHRIKDRVVEAKRATPREESGAPNSHDTTKKLFVGGLKKEITEAQLKEYFGQYGTIEKVDIIKNSNGDLRGFAFISYEDYDSVDKAVLMRPHTIGGFKLDCKKGISKESMRSGPPPSGGRSAPPRHGGPPPHYAYGGGPYAPAPHAPYGRDPYYDPYGYPPQQPRGPGAWGYGYAGGYGDEAWQAGQGYHSYEAREDYNQGPDAYAQGPSEAASYPQGASAGASYGDYGSYATGPGPARHGPNRQIKQDPYDRPAPGQAHPYGARPPHQGR
ncbi:hypothetical protein Ciccas_010958 [Cichlidogyrus casuarinus]|uniref:RRM domain-containing protein n=1 Tax=Cichlidogyrus casuarinus TaxID=1844966 RepID=A0ABD2PXA9_9PLAT